MRAFVRPTTSVRHPLNLAAEERGGERGVAQKGRGQAQWVARGRGPSQEPLHHHIDHVQAVVDERAQGQQACHQEGEEGLGRAHQQALRAVPQAAEVR